MNPLTDPLLCAICAQIITYRIELETTQAFIDRRAGHCPDMLDRAEILAGTIARLQKEFRELAQSRKNIQP